VLLWGGVVFGGWGLFWVSFFFGWGFVVGWVGLGGCGLGWCVGGLGLVGFEVVFGGFCLVGVGGLLGVLWGCGLGGVGGGVLWGVVVWCGGGFLWWGEGGVGAGGVCVFWVCGFCGFFLGGWV